MRNVAAMIAVVILSALCLGGCRKNNTPAAFPININSGGRDLAPGIRVLGGGVLQFVIEGNRGYMLRPWGIDVFDLSASTPVLLGWAPLNGHGSYLGVQNDLVYIGYWGNNDLVIYDAVDPGNIVEIGRLMLPDNCLEFAFAGSYVYVANSNAGFSVVDISDPTAPQFIGSTDLGNYVGSARIFGGRLYVTATTSGTFIYDLSTPAAPALLGQIPASWSSQTVSLQSDKLLIAGGIGAMQVVDVSDPALPVELGLAPSLDYGLDVAWYGTWAYMADSEAGIQVIDASSPATPFRVRTLDQVGGYTRSVLVFADRLYATDLVGGLAIYELNDPSDPQLLFRVEQGAGVEGLAISNDMAYITNRHALSIVSLIAEYTLGSADVLEYSEEVAVGGGFAYCEGNDFSSAWIDVLNVSDPTAPVKVARYVFPGPRVIAQRMSVQGSALYVARSTAGLETYDISNPTDLQLLDAFLTGGTALGLALRSNQAFVGDTTNGLVVLDVTSPAAIGFVSNLPEPNTGWVALNGNIAYTSDATPQSFQVLDITNSASPALLNVVLTTSSSIRDMAVANGRLFLAMGTDGLLVYDLLDPTMPVLEGQLFAGQDIWRVAAWRSWIVAGDRYAGLYLIDPDTVIYP